MRPPRRTYTPSRVVAYWHDRGEPFTVDPDHPECFACGRAAAAWGDLERAHLIDRIYDGLDGPQNLAMLCRRCHGAMPGHHPGQEQDAIGYVVNGGCWVTFLGILQRPEMQAAMAAAEAAWNAEHGGGADAEAT
jgi:hypothetical protein